MFFCELEESEFLEFLNQHPLKSFVQTPEMAKYKENHGSVIFYVGVKEKDTILCATMMICTKGHFGKNVFYAPNGFLIDFNDTKLLKFFTKEIRKFIRKKKGYVLTMDPYYPLKERDINGNLVENGFDHSLLISELKKMGYFYKGTSSQVKYMFVLDLEGKDANQLLKEMKPSTRSSIQKSLREGIVVRELGYEELPLFKSLTSASSEYHHFQDRSLEYYQEMYCLFSLRHLIKYVVCELHFDDYQKGISKELTKVREKLEKLKETDGRRKDCLDQIRQLEKRKAEANELQKEKGDVLVISGGMFLLYGEEVLYLFSGNLKEYMHFNTAYRIQWEMIQYALFHHYKRYNFYGILGTEKNSPGYSVYQFKKGFNGYVVELIGEFELPTHFLYYFKKFVYKWFHFMKK